MHTNDITQLDACALSQAIHQHTVRCVEVMQAYLARIHRLNPTFNAIVNLKPDAEILAISQACDDELAAGHSRGWMHGFPLAIKDTGHAMGFPTTFGSPLLKSALATQDSLMTARMKSAGGIVIGKTNMPELGLGSHTFNTLFGATPNAWDTSVSAGGSSGGAAVALAQRMLPVADGSDFMGSLRNPAAWNNVFGMRPSQGRVPFWPTADVWVDQLGTEGPMARSMRDLVALLATQSGWDARTPLAIAEPAGSFPDKLEAANLSQVRIAWLGDLNGHLAMEEGLMNTCESALDLMRLHGAEVKAMQPNFDPAQVWESWLVWRAALVGSRVAGLLDLPNARAQIKPEALWEHDQMQGVSAQKWMQASKSRSAFYAKLLEMLNEFDVIALPATQVWPFPIAQRWPQTIAGRHMDTYHRWMETTIYATLAGLPAISLPAGFDASNRWPAGVQLIGRRGGDAALLEIGLAYEKLISHWLNRCPS